MAKVNKVILKLSCLLITLNDVRYRAEIVFAVGSENYWDCFMFDTWLSEIKCSYEESHNSLKTKSYIANLFWRRIIRP